MTETSKMQTLISYLGRRIEVVLPVVLLFSLACLGFGVFAERAQLANLALLWVPAVTGALSALIAMVFVAYLVVARPELLKRVKVVYRERIVPIEPGTAAPETYSSREQ
jgi:hypothetical protein